MIVRNLKISKVKGNDGISVIKSSELSPGAPDLLFQSTHASEARVWIDHNEFVSDLNNGVGKFA